MGLWDSVLFRAYAQRTLRAAMVKAVNERSLPAFVKFFAPSLLENDDTLLAIYDHAIRSQVDQSGDLNRDG
ncbi:MAG: hypothetical protein P4M01_07895 [Acidobacteriota bacterium]|nr:hypothetical protein [Acidobacteriota bacterium]